ncbi:MAG TPA: hypothetical protein PLO64_04430 [Methanothermobacter sp.]|nr:conserved hypothetical protein [Methanothermobacter sp. MT-2]HHW05843.1 hypothetical protein [Methanothermobacter sp.]HOK72439.1 hypothetical protein [Methanothermobacter sp.]HOL69158.1 hypothetical protein [Methanothermobacter sp.]HPQ03926.1 hypothetical protein [Methanothermobacter sp.]
MIEPLLYPISGFLMKLADDLADERKTWIGVIAGILCGACIGFLVTISIDAAYIFFGILLGTLLAGKIDNLNHFLAATLFLLIVLLKGLPALEPITLIICVLAAFIDEIGHDLYPHNRHLFKVFEYRFTLKITLLALIIIPYFITFIKGIKWYSFIFFLLFELAYELTGQFNKHLLKDL